MKPPCVEHMIQMSTLFKYFKNKPRSELPSKLQANVYLTFRDIESANKRVKTEIDNSEMPVLCKSILNCFVLMVAQSTCA